MTLQYLLVATAALIMAAEAQSSYAYAYPYATSRTSVSTPTYGYSYSRPVPGAAVTAPTFYSLAAPRYYSYGPYSYAYNPYNTHNNYNPYNTYSGYNPYNPYNNYPYRASYPGYLGVAFASGAVNPNKPIMPKPGRPVGQRPTDITASGDNQNVVIKNLIVCIYHGMDSPDCAMNSRSAN